MEAINGRLSKLSLCQEIEETNLHVVRDCIEAKRIWAHLIPLDIFQKFFPLPLKEWVTWNLSSVTLHNRVCSWKVKFAVIS